LTPDESCGTSRRPTRPGAKTRDASVDRALDRLLALDRGRAGATTRGRDGIETQSRRNRHERAR